MSKKGQKEGAGNIREQQRQQTKKALLNKDFVKNNESFTPDQVMEIFDAFDCFVTPGTRSINIGNLISCAGSLGLDEKHPTIMKVLEGIADDNGDIEFDTFVEELTARMGNAREPKGREALFKLIDRDQKGELTVDDLKSLAKEVGHIISEEELKEVMDNISKGNPISYEEFDRYLARKMDR